jgi:hypothetical protein
MGAFKKEKAFRNNTLSALSGIMALLRKSAKDNIPLSRNKKLCLRKKHYLLL